MLRFTKKERAIFEQSVKTIRELFLENYRDKKSELNYDNLYQLVVAVTLSAQCTDKRVNIITPKLFAKYPDTEALAKADVEEVKELIGSCTYFQNKAKNIILMAQKVETEFNSQIPLTQKELMSLNGVGQKTANVVLIEYKNENVMAVDTHVFRVAHRLGLSYSKTAKETEADLKRVFKTDLNQLHQAFVLFGRYICKSQNPECHKCFLTQFCKSKEPYKARG
jgi:endonuclease-3